MPAPFNWGQFLGDALQGVGGGLMNYGSGGNFSQGFQGGMQNAGQTRDSALNRQIREQQLALQQEEADRQRTANQQKAEKDRAWKAMLDGLSGGQMAGVPMRPQPNAGFSAAQFGGGVQTASGQNPMGAALAGLPQNVRDALPMMDRDQGQATLIDYMLKQGQGGDAPKTVGGMQWNAKTNAFEAIPGYADQASAIAAAGRQPAQPKTPNIITLHKDGKTQSLFDNDPNIAGMLTGGWVEEKPAGDTVLAQVGTDADGKPIYDYVPKAAGPTKEFEVKAANQAVLLDQGLGELERLYKNPDVSAWRIAGSEQAGEMGPLAGVAGQKLLSDKDKQFISGRARALESLANTITGAAFTDEQKRNFTAMLPQPTDDAETAGIKIKQAKEYLASIKRGAKVSDQPSGGDLNYDASGKRIP